MARLTRVYITVNTPSLTHYLHIKLVTGRCLLILGIVSESRSGASATWSRKNVNGGPTPSSVTETCAFLNGPRNQKTTQQHENMSRANKNRARSDFAISVFYPLSSFLTRLVFLPVVPSTGELFTLPHHQLWWLFLALLWPTKAKCRTEFLRNMNDRFEYFIVFFIEQKF